MSNYTLQKHIDHLELGERWACTYCGPINVMEHVTGEQMTEPELDEIVGHCFRRRFADMANYIDHAKQDKTAADCTSWDDKDNPEWHYWVKKRAEFLRYLEFRFRTRIPYDLFKVAIMKTQHGTNHYCILINTGKLINPDPSLKGPIIEKRPLVY